MIFRFFMEVSIAKRPFEHILWPEVCKYTIISEREALRANKGWGE